MKHYQRVAAAVFDKPWAILEDRYATIVEIVSERMAGRELSAEEIASRIGSVSPRGTSQSGDVAVIPLEGVLLRKAGMIERASGASSLNDFMGAVRAAVADPGIASIVLAIDSPGGEVDGMPEAAAELRAMRDQKRIVAVADTMAASAAYWLGSQATEFVASPSAKVGSIGVVTYHQDITAAAEMEGVKFTVVSSTPEKAEGLPMVPLTDGAIAHVQGIIDEYYAMFVGDVAKGRGTTPAAVRADYGSGRILMAKGAKAVGMVDRIDTLAGVIRRELGAPRRPAQAAALGPGWLESASTTHVHRIGGLLPEPEPAPTPEPEPEPVAAIDPHFAFERERRRRAIGLR